MPHPNNKFSPVRAARLSLLLTLSLTAGIGTAIYAPLGQKQAQTPQIAPVETRSVTADAGLSTDSASSDAGVPFDRDSDATATDQQSFLRSASASSFNTGPQVVQTTQAPVIASTRGS